MDASKVAFEVESLVARIAGDGEQFGKRQLEVAMKDFEPLDLCERFIPRPIGSQPLDFDGQQGAAAVGERNRHTGVGQVVWMCRRFYLRASWLATRCEY